MQPGQETTCTVKKMMAHAGMQRLQRANVANKVNQALTLSLKLEGKKVNIENCEQRGKRIRSITKTEHLKAGHGVLLILTEGAGDNMCTVMNAPLIARYGLGHVAIAILVRKAAAHNARNLNSHAAKYSLE